MKSNKWTFQGEQLKGVDLIGRPYPFVLPLFFLSSASNTDMLAGIQQLLQNLRLKMEIKSMTRIMKQKRQNKPEHLQGHCTSLKCQTLDFLSLRELGLLLSSKYNSFLTDCDSLPNLANLSCQLIRGYLLRITWNYVSLHQLSI